MKTWVQKNKEYNLKELEKDIIIAVPSVNKFLDTFHYYLMNELEKRDMEYLENREINERRDLLLSEISDITQNVLKMTFAIEGAWPSKRKWYHIFKR